MVKGKLDCGLKYNPKETTHCCMGWLLRNGRKRQELIAKKRQKEGCELGQTQKTEWELGNVTKRRDKEKRSRAE